ncbi:hypothetical protein FA13DRAFT_1692416 [Coprinellus micaceus]|uniref:DNA mismatch repair proteins mutS family domain-containing protein n=1 Tax=Coprinellus micaceus TaxID=71717 RepID=A0A4Y7SWV1_COPMI|nr:hypothetical protein FA13DRAFT_1692416 [Coprinellus micaceus]
MSSAYDGRPTTARSTRPGTARPQTGVSTVYQEGSFVIALLEGRGVSREVGLAALNKDTGEVNLVQIADCQTYVKTLHQMHLHYPTTVLVPDTFLSAPDAAFAPSGKRSTATSLLVEYIGEEFPESQIEPVSRKYWNDGGGLEFILQLCVDDNERAGTLLAVSNKYYALSAACALFKYVEAKLNTCFAPGSLRIRYVPVEGTMMIDRETALNLELVGNMHSRKSTHSLFGTLNHTYTAMATRLLRVNILSPILVQPSLDARLDAVEELVNSEDRFNVLRDSLRPMNKMDFDKLIVSLASTETTPSLSAKPASQRVSQMLSLRSVVTQLPGLRGALDGCKSQLLRIICDMVSDQRIDEIESLIARSLNEECGPAKGGIGAVNARVYAVKAHQNRLLDVARETYKENVGDIYQLNKSLSAEHDLPLTLVYQESGFVFSVKSADVDGRELPPGFINATLKKGRYMFSSMELKKMNARMKDALDESLLLSDKIIQDLTAEILVHAGALYKASEAVALIDMLWSFAHASIIRQYVRPEFTGTLAIKGGKHPVLEIVQAAGTLVPNDVYCDASSSFQIIQGPKCVFLSSSFCTYLLALFWPTHPPSRPLNSMSGKSTYLRQLGLLTVMAMIGCFVPAEYASFKLFDALLTRLSNDDDLERGLSTFANEMTSSAMILGLATPDSLVLIDELGRGTSPREGVGISHAIAEALISAKPCVFFATHFEELSMTLSRHPSVVNLHLSVQRTAQTATNFGMVFRYKILDGVSEHTFHYGLELARLADLPSDILQEGRRVAEKLAELQKKQEEESEGSQIALRRKVLLRLRTQLKQVLNHSTLPDEDLLEYLKRFNGDIANAFVNL